ncbi:MAG: acyl-CoA thioesterase [Deltaproteobacteria bacterium]|nr:acyl-CoA thioesterase [Deltaproteobacteria bacterium]
MSFTFTTPVRFSDIDHAGIVYYPRFFHLFHLAFEELWRARIGPRAYSELIDRDRVGFPAVRAECDFKAPLKFGDSAEIELTVPRLGAKSITFRYRVFRSADGETTPQVTDDRERRLCADGTVVCAVVDLARFVAMPVPERVVQMLSDLVVP